MKAATKKVSLGTMYKNLIFRTLNLIIKPRIAWQNIFNEKKDLNDVLSSFVLPYTCIATLISFANYLLIHGIQYKEALINAIVTFSTLFGTFMITNLIMKRYLPDFVSKKSKLKTKNISAQLVGHSMLSIYLHTIISTIIPNTTWLIGITLHTFYLCWSASSVISFNKKENKIIVTIVMGLLIITLPLFIQVLLNKLTLGL